MCLELQENQVLCKAAGVSILGVDFNSPHNFVYFRFYNKQQGGEFKTTASRRVLYRGSSFLKTYALGWAI